MTVKACRTFSRAGHMFYCSRTTEIFSVRSTAAPGSVERARQRNRASAVEWRSVIVGGSELRLNAVTEDGWNCPMRFVDKIRGHWARRFAVAAITAAVLPGVVGLAGGSA